jgi:hypothetical protein
MKIPIEIDMYYVGRAYSTYKWLMESLHELKFVRIISVVPTGLVHVSPIGTTDILREDFNPHRNIY